MGRSSLGHRCRLQAQRNRRPLENNLGVRGGRWANAKTLRIDKAVLKFRLCPELSTGWNMYRAARIVIVYQAASVE